MSRNFFNGTDAELYVGSTNFLAIVMVDPITYGMTVTQTGAYDALNIVWTGAYERATNPLTRTRANVAAKNAARAAIVAMSADLARIIDGTPTVTDAQKIELGLNVRKAPVPVPAPTEAPAVDLGSVVNRTVSSCQLLVASCWLLVAGFPLATGN
jgi:hypothetical protein